MNVRKISHSQLTAWLAAALIPTTIQLTAGESWPSVLLVSVLSLVMVWLRWCVGATPQGKLYAALQWLLLVAVLISVAHQAVQSWPAGAHPVISIVLLGLAAWSVWKGAAACASVGCVLFWFVLGLYLVLLGAGVKDVRIAWMKPAMDEVNALGCVLFLTPAAAAIHLNSKEGIKPKLLLIGVITTLAAAITAGVLSPEVAAQKPNAFYEMTRSLNLLGQARRFEAVLSAGMTASWFSLMSIYLSLCDRQAETIRSGWGKRGNLVAAAAAGVGLLCDLHIPAFALLIAIALFWVLIPLLAQGLGAEKKS